MHQLELRGPQRVAPEAEGDLAARAVVWPAAVVAKKGAHHLRSYLCCGGVVGDGGDDLGHTQRIFHLIEEGIQSNGKLYPD